MKKIKYEGEKPAPRGNALFFQGKTYFLIGGASRIEEFNDFWAFSLDSKQLEGQWKPLQYKGPSKLPARMGMAFAKVGNTVFLHGGQNFAENKHFQSFYTLNLGKLLYIFIYYILYIIYRLP